MKWFGLKRQKSPESLYEMAQQLHLERRLHPRVRLPLSQDSYCGPIARVDGQIIRIGDISEGGVCLIDNDDVLRSKIGQKFVVDFECTHENSIVQSKVESKLVGSNLNKKHIQFESTQNAFVSSIRPWINTGLRAIWMKDFASLQTENSPARFKLFWGSILEDSFVSSTDPRWEFELYLKGHRYCISMATWPSHFEEKVRVSPVEFDHLITFFSNIDTKLFSGQVDLVKRLGELRQHEPT